MKMERCELMTGAKKVKRCCCNSLFAKLIRNMNALKFFIKSNGPILFKTPSAASTSVLQLLLLLTCMFSLLLQIGYVTIVLSSPYSIVFLH
jgi:hypothetical protein